MSPPILLNHVKRKLAAGATISAFMMTIPGVSLDPGFAVPLIETVARTAVQLAR